MPARPRAEVGQSNASSSWLLPLTRSTAEAILCGRPTHAAIGANRRTSVLPHVCLLAIAAAAGCQRSDSTSPAAATARPQTEAGEAQAAPGAGAPPVAVPEETSVPTALIVEAAARIPPTIKPAPADGPELRAEAAEFFAELVERVPNDPDALEVKARFHLLIGESQAAKECWEQALRLAPDYAYAQHGLGKVAMLNAEPQRAVEYFQKAIAGQSDNLDPVHDLADAYMKLGEVEQAIELLRGASQEHSQSTSTWVLLGQAYLANRDFASARDAFERALTLSPDLPRAQQGLGTALMRLGQRERARTLLETQRINRVAGKNRSDAETFADELAEVAKRYTFAARVYLAHGQTEQAEYALRRATVLQPREESAWAVLLSYYQNQKRLGDAVNAAAEMCRIAPENPSYHFTLGVLCGQAHDVAKARAEFEEVIRLAPRSVEGYQALVKLLLNADSSRVPGRNQTAGEELKQSIELAQKAVELRGAASDFELLAQTYAVNARFDEAHQALAHAIELDANNQAYCQAMRQLEGVMREQR